MVKKKGGLLKINNKMVPVYTYFIILSFNGLFQLIKQLPVTVLSLKRLALYLCS